MNDEEEDNESTISYIGWPDLWKIQRDYNERIMESIKKLSQKTDAPTPTCESIDDKCK